MKRPPGEKMGGQTSDKSARATKTGSAANFLPVTRTFEELREAASKCEGCELYRNATQTVFGVGPVSAPLMIVGEAPGDKEDEAGQPFVGPAGKLLDEGLKAAGISRQDVYVTNAVKHFKWEASGTRRLHAKPSAREIAACHPWLEAEIELIAPKLIVCLGATAAQSLQGRTFRITQQRGQVLSLPNSIAVISTWHPSAVLRVPDAEARADMREELFKDLGTAAKHIAELTS
jgi:uracil-DNA glycosylase family protein